MSVDLSKCKVGDKCMTRRGETVKLTNISASHGFPFTFDDCLSRDVNGYWLGLGQETDIDDIVSVCKLERRKVAKVKIHTVIQDSAKPFYQWTCDIGSQSVLGREGYSLKRSAIRGAIRFCALIRFDCEVVK